MHRSLINKPTHVSGSLIDYIYIKKALMEKFFTNAPVQNIYFSYRDTVRTVDEKSFLDFHTISR